jgi:hypothetical protein
MFHKICDKLPDSQPRGRQTAIRSAKSVVVACLMRFGGCFCRRKVWSFSMLSEAGFLRLGHLGYGVLKLLEFDGVENLD